MERRLLVYGAYGFTGRLVARAATARGLRPVLAGRSAGPLRALAEELGLEHRAFALDDAAAVEAGLTGMAAVLHCAGPFAQTWRPMAAACLRARCHYLDLTGEIEVFEGLAALEGEARAAGVMLLPGAGFDVVPSDGLLAHVARRLRRAERLSLVVRGLARVSRGTALTMLANPAGAGLARRGGRLVRAFRPGEARTFELGARRLDAAAVPWGDLATAPRSTGVGDVDTWFVLTRPARLGLRLVPLVAPALRSARLRRTIASWMAHGDGPDAAARARARVALWAIAEGGGERAVSELRCGDPYDLTAASAVLLAARALAGEAPPGFQTPSLAYGPDLALGLPGVARRDL